MSYNPVTSTCLLAEQPCVKAEKHDEFMLVIFREQEHVDCAVWVRDQQSVVPERLLNGSHNTHVGRVFLGDDVVVGATTKPGDNWSTYMVRDGDVVNFRNNDLLTVHPNCTMAWLPYKAGEVLPQKAIVTGILANGRRIYSSASWRAGIWRIGSYTEGDTTAYYAHSGSNAVKEFDILVAV